MARCRPPAFLPECKGEESIKSASFLAFMFKYRSVICQPQRGMDIGTYGIQFFLLVTVKIIFPLTFLFFLQQLFFFRF